MNTAPTRATRKRIVPKPDAIRERLAELARERSLLRGLLRVLSRHQQQRRGQAQEGAGAA